MSEEKGTKKQLSGTNNYHERGEKLGFNVGHVDFDLQGISKGKR